MVRGTLNDNCKKKKKTITPKYFIINRAPQNHETFVITIFLRPISAVRHKPERIILYGTVRLQYTPM